MNKKKNRGKIARAAAKIRRPPPNPSRVFQQAGRHPLFLKLHKLSLNPTVAMGEVISGNVR